MTDPDFSDVPWEEIPRLMAAQIRPIFAEPNLARYERYLSAMYHYTRFSGPELDYAARIAPTAELRALFERMAREEANHYRLAEQDLRSLGASIDVEAPASVLAYRRFWNGMGDAYGLLGALYALENVASEVGEGAIEVLQQLGLAPKSCTFVSVHLSEDDAHGRLLAEACSEARHAHAAALTDGARQAARHWVAMHLSILESPA
jgi:hypothetical protein